METDREVHLEIRIEAETGMYDEGKRDAENGEDERRGVDVHVT